MKILHGDIKGENILVGNELSYKPIVKYGDFDFADRNKTKFRRRF